MHFNNIFSASQNILHFNLLLNLSLFYGRINILPLILILFMHVKHAAFFVSLTILPCLRHSLLFLFALRDFALRAAKAYGDSELHYLMPIFNFSSVAMLFNPRISRAVRSLAIKIF